MDPLSTATLFATLVSLLADFKSQQQGRSDDEFNDLLLWLTASRHGELKSLIEQNSVTTIGIKALLNESKADLAEKLERLDHKLALLMSDDADFSSVALGI